MNLISVIICTHNPRRDYLDRVLHALREQTLSVEDWELLLVDNASDRILSQEIDLSWHPQGRHIREDELGLTPARLRGIKEATSEVLVFVDDDNLLDANFLEIALEISKDWRILGAWGGQIRAEFEEAPPEWIKPFLPMLAVREFSQDKWSNLTQHVGTTPCGAGLCVRRVVAERYMWMLQQDDRRIDLDRKGKSLTSCGDSDLAFTACDIGLGTGQFTRLQLTHLISKHRIQESYLLSLMKGIAYSGTILKALRGECLIQPCLSERIYRIYTRWRLDPRSRRFHDASQSGQDLAIQAIKEWAGKYPVL
jgi:glycosyltransferase involved in cell wall biosynthesis